MSGLAAFLGQMLGAAREVAVRASIRRARGPGPSVADDREFMTLFAEGFDTREIARLTGFEEADVYNGIERERAARRAVR